MDLRQLPSLHRWILNHKELPLADYEIAGLPEIATFAVSFVDCTAAAKQCVEAGELAVAAMHEADALRMLERLKIATSVAREEFPMTPFGPGHPVWEA